MNEAPEGFALSFALAEEVSPLNAAMLKFCFDAYGSKVGDGQASSLASVSLEAIGAAPVRGTEFGDTVDMLSMVPGDVVQFSWCKFKGLLEDGGGHYVAFAGDASTLGTHTAIVFQVERAGLSMVCLEQNINGAPEVRHGTYRLGDMIEGSIQCYRPRRAIPETIVSPAGSHGKRFVTLTNLQKTKIMDAFRALDTNRTGFLEFHEFKTVLQEKGLELDQIWKAFNAADVDQDGKIGPEEYIAFVMQAWTAAQAQQQSAQEETEEASLEPKPPASDAILRVGHARRVAAELHQRGAQAAQRRASYLKHRESAARDRFMLGIGADTRSFGESS
eukprot:TRINITY_DN27825_c0_g2_i1.p1 TRINITY_DN27825_c0_g2~~TRINITY_DN27825_c0_g2_i1.p1  ORF type:complete len:332 (-),score=74.39 TRINITY_DN27825_c0_g2_i1:237-1232(-)